MSANLSHAAQGFVNCVVVGKDIVPRLSVVNIGRLIDELVWHCNALIPSQPLSLVCTLLTVCSAWYKFATFCGNFFDLCSSLTVILRYCMLLWKVEHSHLALVAEELDTALSGKTSDK